MPLTTRVNTKKYYMHGWMPKFVIVLTSQMVLYCQRVVFILYPVPQKSELSKNHATQEPLLLLRAQLCPHHHLSGHRGQQPQSGGQKPCE